MKHPRPGPDPHEDDELASERFIDPAEPRTRVRWPFAGQLGRTRTLETVLLASTACLLAAVAWPIATGGGTLPASFHPATPDPDTSTSLPVADEPTIQVALLLDTSSSMDGLIDQARTQLWQVVNALDSATWHGRTPRLEIAVYEYGNDRLSWSSGYIRQVTPFSSELDRVSEALFALSTGGGSEWPTMAISRAADELKWRDGAGVLRVMYVAGNESFLQGPVPLQQAIDQARAKGIVVNTLECTGYGASDEGWADAAQAAGGRFLRIDHEQVAQYVAAPQDAEITRLGELINETYIQYGADGSEGLVNTLTQDRNAVGSGMGSFVQRSLSKSSSMYRNPSWELVDALDEGRVDLEQLDRDSLPENLRELEDDALAEHVQAQKTRRAELEARLRDLQRQREAHLQAHVEDGQNASDSGQSDRLDTAIVHSIVDLAEASGFTVR